MIDAAREAMLNRIRQQLSWESTRTQIEAGADYSGIDRSYHRAGHRTSEETIALFIDRLEDYDARVLRIAENGVSAAAGELLKASGQARVLVPTGYPEAWLPAGIEILRDRGASGPELSHAELDRIHAVLTTCAAAIAITGTLLLQHTSANGRRALTLVPDYYVCVVRPSQIVETVPEGLARIESPQSYPITTVSGPSATADIEMTRIRGVHGPRHLGVIVVDDI